MAQAIAPAWGEIVGARVERAQGYFKVGDDVVTYLIGHMFEQAKPEEYDAAYKNWRDLSLLPIVPKTWKLVPRQDRADQLRVIKPILKSSQRIVNAGDAAREGQLLVDELLLEYGLDPFADNVMRLWLNSYASRDILNALRALIPNAGKRNLFEAARCRQRADWLHGINHSREYTELARRSGAIDRMVSVGRVQTPTLKLVVDRDRLIEGFKDIEFFVPTVTFRHANGGFVATWNPPERHPALGPDGRVRDRAKAEEVANKVAGRTGAVRSFKAEDKSKPPPLPYNLSTLQKDCSAKFGLTAEQTLQVAQSLYETHRIASYPRTDSRHLKVSMLTDEAPHVMQRLGSCQQYAEAVSSADMSIRSEAWDDAKTGDHHGIAPTTDFRPESLEKLSPMERRVFDLIAKTYIAQFHKHKRWKALSANVEAEGEPFRAIGQRLVDPGWTRVYGASDPDDDDQSLADEENQGLPDMKQGDPVKVEASKVVSKKTKPPPRYTDGTLIDDMSHAAKFVTNPEIKRRLKETSGIGTQATRASIIETLIKREFLQRKGKTQLISTPLGRAVIDMLPGELTDIGLTAVWESYLERVEAGELAPDKFVEAQTNLIRKRIEDNRGRQIELKGVKGMIEPLPGHGQPCPKCGQGKLQTVQIRKGEHAGKRFLSCDRHPDCEHREWPKAAVEPLPGHGEKCGKCGQGTMLTRMVTKDGPNKGKRFLSCDRHPECSNSVWPKPEIEPLAGHGEKCGKCGEGTMLTRMVAKDGPNKGKRFLSCDRYPQCDSSVWPEKDSPAQGRGAGGRRSASPRPGRPADPLRSAKAAAVPAAPPPRPAGRPSGGLPSPSMPRPPSGIPRRPTPPRS
jgi:DNA topoisomerase-3